MKINSILIVCVVCAMLLQCTPSKIKEKKLDTSPVENTFNPTWLIGDWERIGEKVGRRTFETWTQINEMHFKGLGCTLNDRDTIWREDIELMKNEFGWEFRVLQLGDSTPTTFKVTDFSPSSFVCENINNDFPKKIEYTFDGTNINAQISGGGPTIPFNFRPANK